MRTALSQLLFAITLAGLATTTSLQGATIYTWEDKRGVIHFSDQAQPGASEVKLHSLPAIKPHDPDKTPSGEPSAPDSAETEDEPPLPPATIRLLTPLHQQTVRNNEGNINVSVITNRKLGSGHSVRLLLDGALYGQPLPRLDWHLVNIDRGSHTLQAQVLKHGKVIASSEMITVYLHRGSRLRRQPPAAKPK